MDYFGFEEKLVVKELVEKSNYLYSNEKKVGLLKGSLDIEQKKVVEKLLKERTCYYIEKEKNKKLFKEAKIYFIGKAIVVLKNDRKEIIEIISLKNFDSGINDLKNFIENTNQEYMECFEKEGGKEGDRLDELIDEFGNLGKFKKIDKGRVLEEIDHILTQNKELGKKIDMWKKLGISNSDKYMFCKRYNLFKEFQENESFAEDNEWRDVIERMTDLNLKKITKEGMSTEEKGNMIVSLI